jgi:hypothetical protein
MNNPFDSGEIKNYLLFYAGVVVIMVLFFIAATLFHDIIPQETKVFDINQSVALDSEVVVEENESKPSHTFKLMPKAY